MCAVCGESLEGMRSSAKFCGPTCKRRSRNAPAKRQADPLPPEVSVYKAVLAEVHAAGIFGSSRATTALAIAERIDSGEETGAALAALSRELLRSLDGLKRGQAEDPVDELAAKRAARLRGGA